jgi:hypothetical protein
MAGEFLTSSGLPASQGRLCCMEFVNTKYLVGYLISWLVSNLVVSVHNETVHNLHSQTSEMTPQAHSPQL